MKKSVKITVIIATVCLLCAAVFVSVISAATVPVQSLSAGTRNAGYLDFDSYTTGSTAFDKSSTQTYSATGSKARLWSNPGWTNDAVMTVKEQSVDGRLNKYLSIVADASYTGTLTSNQAYGMFPTTAVTAADSDGKANDFLVIDIDICADKYVVVNSDGTESKFYDSWDAVVADGKETEAKLAYPENLSFRIEPSYSGYSLPVYIHSKSVETDDGVRLKSYISVYSTTGTYGQMELSDKAGEWNHITLMYELRAVSAQTVVCRAYLDGKYVGKYTKSGGATSVTLKELRLILPYAAINKQASTYSFGIDNWTANVYNDYTPSSSVKNSIASITDLDEDYALYNCDDVVYNSKYLSPNGNSFGLCWSDRDGEELLREEIAIGTIPSADKTEFDLTSLSDLKGNYKSVAAWEWNVSEDPEVFTPVSNLTIDMVKAIRERGDDFVTLRPALCEVEFFGADGETSLGIDVYYKGSTVDVFEAESNGWYSVKYNAKKNLTEGESEDSLALADGKENKFTVDESTAQPKASVSGILYNMSLMTNYYMNIYVPKDTPEGVSFGGFYSDAELKYEITEGRKSVSVEGVSYNELSFAVANSDVDKPFARYLAIEAEIGGNTYSLAYEVNVNLLSYCKAVLEKYECKSAGASLVVNLLRYANEAYTFENGEPNSSAVSTLSKHINCGCLLSEDVTNDYKGSTDGLVGYVYAVSYDISSQAPGMIVYIPEDVAAGVSKITVSYKGFSKEISGELSKFDPVVIDGVSLVPYFYSNISASDVNSVMTLNLHADDDTVIASGTYCLTNYVYDSQNAVARALYAFGKAAHAYKKTVSIPSDDGVIIENITASKATSLLPSMTVSPGSEIEYTITVRNDGEENIVVPIYDSVPANTSYISGDALVKGYDLYWEITLAPGESASVSYTVKVDSDEKLIDSGFINPGIAKVGGHSAQCNGNYIELTLNSVDTEFLKIGILANQYSGFSDTALAKWIYNVAFTKTFTMSGDTKTVLDGIFGVDTEESAKHREMVIPTLYGGTQVGTELDSRFKGERAEALKRSDLIAGDLLLIEEASGARLYIYDGSVLISLTDGYQETDTGTVIARANSALRYAALRPTVIMTTMKHSDPNASAAELTAAQQALLVTAESYVLRGYRLQYDDTKFDQAAANSGEYRWQIGIKAPEDYTVDEWGYINCAAFTYDLYRNSLGYDLGSLYTTSNLVWQYTTNSGARVEWDGVHGKLKKTYNGASLDYKMYPYFLTPTHNETPEEALAIEERIMSELQIGDLLVIRRYVNDTSKSDTGHVMMYIGGGKLVHSTGSNFGYSKDPAEETYEPSIRYMNVHDYLFNPSATNYLFDADSVVDQVGIVRPLASSSYKGAIPQNTQNRIDNMQGIVAEKLSSHQAGQTVNVGDDVTFTFRIFNSNSTDRTITVTDVVPENSTFSSIIGGTYENGNVSFTVTVGAGETAELSYTVTASGENGSYIYGESATVGGVLHKCNKIYIKRTLSASEQQAILEAIEFYSTDNSENLSGLSLVNAIYEKAAAILSERGESSDLRALFGVETTSELAAGIVENKSGSTTVFQLKADGEYAGMLAPTLYGGERMYTPNQYSSSSKATSDRTRLGMEHDLIIGDVVYARYYSGEILYIYAGEDIGFISLTTLEPVTTSVDDVFVRMLGYYYYFVVLRPSQII